MKNKGVTIIEMVIVVIILILLAIIAIWSSKQPTLEAEAALYFSELKAVYTGILKIKQEYDLEIIEDYTSGEHYNVVYKDELGNTVPDWYVIYGIGNIKYSGDAKYNEQIMKNLGVQELKRNYKVNFNTVEVEFLDGPIKLDEYEINSYQDMKTLEESGVI